MWVATSVKQTWSAKSDGNKEPFEPDGKEMIWFFWISMLLSAYALQSIFYSVRNYCRRRRINQVFGRERPVQDVGVQANLLPNPAVPQPPPPPPAVQCSRRMFTLLPRPAQECIGSEIVAVLLVH